MKNFYEIDFNHHMDLRNNKLLDDFLEKEVGKSNDKIYFLIENISFYALSDLIYRIRRKELNQEVIFVFNKSQNEIKLISSFMNNKSEGYLSSEGRYQKYANDIYRHIKEGQVSFYKANKDIEFNAIAGYTAMVGLRRIELSDRDSVKYLFWEDDPDISDEIYQEVQKVLRYCTKTDIINRLIEMLRKDYQLGEIYYLMLLNIFQVEEYGEEQKMIQDAKLGSTSLWNEVLYQFQKDGVLALLHRIENYGGVILADSVGLGKTYQTLAILKYYQDKGQKAIVFAPKKLYNNWKHETAKSKSRSFEDVELEFDVHFHTTLTSLKVPDGSMFENYNYSQYDILVIDEAHAFRNQDSKRYENLMKYVRNANPQMKVILLSATPINNSLYDFESLLKIINGNKRDVNIFDNWVNIHSLLKREQNRIGNALEVTDECRKIINSYIVARDKTYVKSIYQDSEMNFPKKNPVIPLEINGNEQYKVAIDDFYETIISMNFAIYDYYHYIKEDRRAHYRRRYPNIGERSKGMKVLMTILILKRYESLHKSLKQTLEKIVDKMEGWLEFKMNRLSEESHSKNVIVNDTNEIIESLESEEGLITEDDFGLISISDLEPKFFEDVQADIECLNRIINNKVYEEISTKKMDQLKSTIKHIQSNGEKVIVFTSYSDTAESISDILFKDNIKHGLVTGVNYRVKDVLSQSYQDFEHVLERFSPISKGKNVNNNEEIDVLIATDVISEGQNLQDCSNIVNFDIHWNPVKIIQRLGRIERLKSKHESINNYMFWPMDSLDNYLGLREKIKTKSEYSKSFGLETYDQAANVKREKEDFEAIKKGLDIEEDSMITKTMQTSIKKYRINYKRIQEFAEPKMFKEDISLIHELRGVMSYIYDPNQMHKSYFLFRVDNQYFNSDTFPFILAKCQGQNKIELEAATTLKELTELNEDQFIEYQYCTHTGDKKEQNEELVFAQLWNCIEKIKVEYDIRNKENISLIAGITAVPTAHDFYESSRILSPSELLEENQSNGYITDEKSNTFFDNI